MPTVTIHEAKTHLSKLIAAMERGEEVVIKRGATPVARLTPVGPPRQIGEEVDHVPIPKTGRKFGSLKGLVAFDDTFWDPLPEEELAAWEGAGPEFREG